MGAIGAAVVVGIAFPPGEIAAGIRAGLVALAVLGLIAAAVVRCAWRGARFAARSLESRLEHVEAFPDGALVAAQRARPRARLVGVTPRPELARALVGRDRTPRRDAAARHHDAASVEPRRPLLAMAVTAVVLVGLGRGVAAAGPCTRGARCGTRRSRRRRCGWSSSRARYASRPAPRSRCAPACGAAPRVAVSCSPDWTPRPPSPKAAAPRGRGSGASISLS